MLRTETIEITLNDANALLVVPSRSLQGSQKERSLRLSLNLQASLDIEKIIAQFTAGLQAEVPCDSVTYQHADNDLDITIGHAQTHRFHYRLSIKDEYLGELTCSRKQKFNSDEVEQLEAVLCLLLFPLRNALKYHHAVKASLLDPLTGVSNRAALPPALRRDIEIAKRHSLSFSILALDLDHFKGVNDAHGHAAGDALLRAFADTVTECVRDADVVFRTGGEEFIVLLSRTDTQGAILLADRIRKTVEALVCDRKNETLKTSVSIGVATYISGDNDESLLEKADEALYRAKNEGRNRVCI